jgi:hypothetical protein
MAEWPYNTSNWRRLRRAKLSSRPLCEACQLRGRRTLAKAVDHIKPVNQGGHPFPHFDELMSLCTSFRASYPKDSYIRHLAHHQYGCRDKGRGW